MHNAVTIPSRRLQAWLRCSNPHTFWLGRHCAVVAWVGLVAAILLPPHGAGIMTCWVQSGTGVPCPGCGMTRSLSCAVRGLFAESWNYHPFGLFILALFLLTAAQSLVPKPARGRLAQFMQARASFFNGLYLAFVAGFVGFGVVRAVVHCAQHL